MHEKDKLLAYQNGWDAYWRHVTQDENPYENQELRDEWMVGWLTAEDIEKK